MPLSPSNRSGMKKRMGSAFQGLEVPGNDRSPSGREVASGALLRGRFTFFRFASRKMRAEGAERHLRGRGA